MPTNKTNKSVDSIKFRTTFIKLTGISTAIVGIILILWKVSLYFSYYTEISFSKYSLIILLLGIIYLLCGLFIYLKKDSLLKHINLLSSIFVLNFIYLFLEIVLYFASGFPNIELNSHQDKRRFIYNQNCISYDAVSGYKWTKKGSRQVLISSDNELIWDAEISSNNVGYISQQDYYYKKKSHRTKRYMVLGDSFSAAEFNDKSWVDYVQELVHKNDIEFYSFSLSGIGLQNWHSIYFNEISKSYEFDGIIMAFLSSDWQRPFTIFHTDKKNNLLIGGFDAAPANFVDFQNNYLPQMTHKDKWEILSDQEIDATISDQPGYELPRLTLNALEMFYYKIVIRWKNFNTKKGSEKVIDSKEISPTQHLISQQGKAKVELINAIIKDCKDKEKEVIICSIPMKNEVMDFQKEHNIKNDESLKLLCEINNLNYFNGYLWFSLTPEDKLNTYYYKEDLHWNDIGSHFYAMGFSRFLLDKDNTTTQDFEH